MQKSDFRKLRVEKSMLKEAWDHWSETSFSWEVSVNNVHQYEFVISAFVSAIL